MIKINRKILIGASKEKIWETIGDPNNWIHFFPGIKSISKRKNEIGGEVKIKMTWKNKTFHFRGNITALDPGFKISVDLQGVDPRNFDLNQLIISYSIEKQKEQLLVRENVKIAHKLPWWIAGLAKFVLSFGYPREKNSISLRNLKEYLET